MHKLIIMIYIISFFSKMNLFLLLKFRHNSIFEKATIDGNQMQHKIRCLDKNHPVELAEC